MTVDERRVEACLWCPPARRTGNNARVVYRLRSSFGRWKRRGAEWRVAWHGKAGHGLAWPGGARQGAAGRGKVECVAAWYGVA